jgi:Zn-dependent protease
MPTGFSVRAATLFGFPIRVHLLFPLLVVYYVLKTPGYSEPRNLIPVLGFESVLLVSILLHELGHAFVARHHRLGVHGIVIWPLGGVTYHDPERDPRSQLRVSLAGLTVNLFLALAAGIAILVRTGLPPGLPRLAMDPDLPATVWNLNLALLLLNLLPGLPFDGGQALEALLWPRFGHAKARFVVIGSGLVVAVGVLLGGITQGEPMLVVVGGWALWSVGRSYQEFRERGVEEDQTFLGHDFSQGYTSLEAGAPEPDAAVRRRAKERERAERAERAAEERVVADRRAEEGARLRLDRLLDRIAARGITSLTPEERTFLDEESRRLRARNRGRSPSRP